MSMETKFRAEEIISLVRRCLNGELGIREAGRVAGTTDTSIRRWIARYKVEGITGFLSQRSQRVYSPELKHAAIEDYLLGTGSLLDICQKYRIKSDRTLRNWIEVYNAHGDLNSVKFSGGGSYMKQGRNTTHEERIEIAQECIATGKNYGEMALKYKVSYQQVRTWTLRYEELGKTGLEDRRGQRKKDQQPRTELEQAQVEIEQLKHKLKMLEMENRLLKKLEEIERRGR